VVAGTVVLDVEIVVDELVVTDGTVVLVVGRVVLDVEIAGTVVLDVEVAPAT